MLNVVFTGPAVDVLGQSIVRANLIAACNKLGTVSVQPAVKANTNLVVASRADTVKAKSATARGLKVLTYPEFLTQHLAGVAIPTDGKWSGFTDAAVSKKVQATAPSGEAGLSPAHIL